MAIKSYLIKELCHGALIGKLELERFYESWPEDVDEDRFYKQIYKDIEDLVEHAPGSLISGEVDVALMQRFHNYLVVYLDCILLEYARSTDELKRCRDHLLCQKGLSKENAEDFVKTYMQSKKVEGSHPCS